MTTLPTFCPNCKSIFPFHGIGLGEGVTIDLRSIGTNCPVCGYQGARVSDGVYKATKDAIELVSGPASTRELLEALRKLTERLSAGEINKAEAIQEASALSPQYASLIATFANLGIPALSLLVALISAYLQYDNNQSTGEDAKKLLQAITEQTFSMKQALGQQQRLPRIKEAKKPKRPTLKTIVPKPRKPPTTAAPSQRRVEVNRQRRSALKQRRQSFLKSRTC